MCILFLYGLYLIRRQIVRMLLAVAVVSLVGFAGSVALAYLSDYEPLRSPLAAKTQTTGGEVGVRLVAGRYDQDIVVSHFGSTGYLSKVGLRCTGSPNVKEIWEDVGFGVPPGGRTTIRHTGYLDAAADCIAVSATYNEIRPVPGVALVTATAGGLPVFTVTNRRDIRIGDPEIACVWTDETGTSQDWDDTFVTGFVAAGETIRLAPPADRASPELVEAIRRHRPLACWVRVVKVVKAENRRS
jgi:hypothetical protein